MSLVPCPRCRRHLRVAEGRCPFCAAPGHARVLGLALAGALAGCGEEAPPPPPPVPAVVEAPPPAAPSPPPVAAPPAPEPVVAAPETSPPPEPSPPEVEALAPEAPPEPDTTEPPARRRRTRVDVPDERTIAAYGAPPDRGPGDPF